LNISPGSCLGVALDAYKPLGKVAKDAQKYAKDFAPAIAMLPAAAVQDGNVGAKPWSLVGHQGG
jgi:hypothetical protein